MASIFGPLLGAYITDHISWRWVFYINIPLGIACFLLIALFYHESAQHSKQKIDWLGVVTLVPAVGSLMFALQLGGGKHPWNSGLILGLFAAAGILLVTFLYVETKAAERPSHLTRRNWLTVIRTHVCMRVLPDKISRSGKVYYGTEPCV